jgi:hypothetical protein
LKVAPRRNQLKGRPAYPVSDKLAFLFASESPYDSLAGIVMTRVLAWWLRLENKLKGVQKISNRKGG